MYVLQIKAAAQELSLQLVQHGMSQKQSQCEFLLKRDPSSSDMPDNISIMVAGSPAQAEGSSMMRLAVEGPLGSYPDGSKMLMGQDEKFVLSPLGNIVDERYTTYFEFQKL